MPSLFSIVSKAFRAIDLFPTSKLLRYNGESEYTTTTGGVISLTAIILFVVLFASMGLRTVNKEIITSSVNIQN